MHPGIQKDFDGTGNLVFEHVQNCSSTTRLDDQRERNALVTNTQPLTQKGALMSYQAKLYI